MDGRGQTIRSGTAGDIRKLRPRKAGARAVGFTGLAPSQVTCLLKTRVRNRSPIVGMLPFTLCTLHVSRVSSGHFYFMLRASISSFVSLRHGFIMVKVIGDRVNDACCIGTMHSLVQ
ncbi:uncharacterized protein LOC109610916 isoform X1 [Ooceraea biroi]|uniref:uncharacterized protein LOC109610916 isoform X1 n=1 Tax=Ooceraea biroi TaxID=2015173 RepID=UPI00097170D0|nr:uncharacterized protein LOC109610916 isoform X1 [Ooceraea biroi]